MPNGRSHYSKSFHLSFHASASVTHSASMKQRVDTLGFEHIQSLTVGITLLETLLCAEIMVGGWQQTEH